MITETEELVKQAQEKRYSDFDKSTKEVLAQKVAEKLAEKGYFDRLDQAKGITEAKGDLGGIVMDIDAMYDIDMPGKEGKDWKYGKMADKAGSNKGDYVIINPKIEKAVIAAAKKAGVKIQLMRFTK